MLAQPLGRVLLMLALVACFAFQTALVYTDRKAEPLGEDALAGRILYHENACQVCHQTYGQGGFLGPDLTNASSRVDDVRLSSLLSVGSGQMPAFGFTAREVAQMRAYLDALDDPELGRGQLRLGTAGQDENAAFARAVDAATAPSSPESRGFAAFSGRGCTACHQPFRTSIVGAPDLSRTAGRLSEDELQAVLIDGRPTLGMPPPTPAFTAAELDDMIAYLDWLGSERESLQGTLSSGAARPNVDWRRIPWWSYR